MMYKLGIIGNPLGHSISPIIQKAGFESIGLDVQYDLLETTGEDLIERIKFLKNNGYDGFNVTIPLKIPIIFFVDKLDEYVNIAGCTNTVKITGENRMLEAYNTDIYGFKTAIPEDINLKDKHACILGTGGASRAATVGLIEKGIGSIDFFSRNIINAEQGVNFLREKFPKVKFGLKQIQYIGELPDTAIVVNATPVGMLGFAADEKPLRDEVIRTLDKNTLIYDIVYNPLTTVLLKSSQQAGLRTVSGLDMLIYQAQRAIQIWTGKTPDVKDMKIAALESVVQ